MNITPERLRIVREYLSEMLSIAKNHGVRASVSEHASPLDSFVALGERQCLEDAITVLDAFAHSETGPILESALALLSDLREMTLVRGYPTLGLGAEVDDFLRAHYTAAQERPLNTNGGRETGHIGPQSECPAARGEAPRVPASAVSAEGQGELLRLRAELSSIEHQLTTLGIPRRTVQQVTSDRVYDLIHNYYVPAKQWCAPSATQDSEEAFREGLRLGRLGYSTIDEIIAAEERDPERKAALDKARAWLRGTERTGPSSTRSKA